MDAYFEDGSEFVKKAGHTVEVFVVRIPALLSAAKKKAADRNSGGAGDYERLKEQREKAADVTFDDEVDDETTGRGET